MIFGRASVLTIWEKQNTSAHRVEWGVLKISPPRRALLPEITLVDTSTASTAKFSLDAAMGGRTIDRVHDHSDEHTLSCACDGCRTNLPKIQHKCTVLFLHWARTAQSGKIPSSHNLHIPKHSPAAPQGRFLRHYQFHLLSTCTCDDQQRRCARRRLPHLSQRSQKPCWCGRPTSHTSAQIHLGYTRKSCQRTPNCCAMGPCPGPMHHWQLPRHQGVRPHVAGMPWFGTRCSPDRSTTLRVHHCKSISPRSLSG